MFTEVPTVVRKYDHAMLLVAMLAVVSETMYLLWFTRECPGHSLSIPSVEFHPGTTNLRTSRLPIHDTDGLVKVNSSLLS